MKEHINKQKTIPKHKKMKCRASPGGDVTNKVLETNQDKTT